MPIRTEDLYGAAPANNTRSGPGKGDKGGAVNFVNAMFQQSRNLRRREEGHWYIDARYLSGDQWVVWDPRNLAMSVRAKKHWRIRQTINHLRESSEVLLNVLTSAKPTLNAVPSSSEPDDRQAAMACDRLLGYLWNDNHIDDLLDEALLWMLVTGRGFMKVGFDPDKGPMVTMPDYDMLPPGVVPGPGLEVPMVEERAGEVVTVAISPFNMHVDPAATRMDDARWVGHEQYMHVEEARYRWGDKSIQPDGGIDVWYNYQRRLLYEQGAQSSAEDLQDTVTIRELYMRPDSRNRQGRKIVVANNRVVEDGDNTTPGGEFPYVDFACYPNVGSYWCTGALHLGRNTQTSYNRARSIQMEILRKHGNPQWLMAKGAGLSRSALHDQPGNVVAYNPIFGPTPPVVQVSGSQAPAGWSEVMAMDLNDLRSQMGVVDVMRGVNPPGVRSGRSISYLTEQNMGRHGPLIRRFERSIQRWGKLALNFAKEFYDEERTLSIIGEGNAVSVYNLASADLQSVRDVMVVPGSAMPQSKVARQDLILQMYQMGLVVDESGMPDPRKAMRLVEMSSTHDLYTYDDDDLQWANEENERMASGEQLLPQMHDNHPMHFDTHTAFMRTSRYRRLPPEIQQFFVMHRDKTLEFIAAAAEVEAGRADMTGGPGGAPSPTEEEPRSDMRGGPE